VVQPEAAGDGMDLGKKKRKYVRRAPTVLDHKAELNGALAALEQLKETLLAMASRQALQDERHARLVEALKG
jgi:beta-phosphoglucomutase-like phosphatase (HAD superfamily)